MTKTYNAEGIIVIRANILGALTNIVIDDFLPFSRNTPFFAQNPTWNSAFWAPFLEKAWAKANGNYEFIENGLSHEAMNFLTGAPTRTFVKGTDVRSPKESFGVILTARNFG